jgi:hypothetical protein
MTNEVSVYGVKHDHITEVWQVASPFIERALYHARGKFVLDDIKKNLENRIMQLWLAFTNEDLSACFVTHVLDFPQERTLEIVFCGGDELDIWDEPVWEVISDYGRTNKCKSCEVIGRRGWKKKLAKFGFEEVQTIFRVLL